MHIGIKRGLLLIMVLLVGFLGLNNLSTAQLPNGQNKKIDLKFLEVTTDQDKLFNDANYVISGRITKVKEKIIDLKDYEEQDKVRMQVPFIVYELEVKDNYKGLTRDTQKIDIVLIDSIQFSELIQVGKEYLFVLEDNSLLIGKLSPVSYAQGIFEIGSNNIAKSLYTQMEIELTDFEI